MRGTHDTLRCMLRPAGGVRFKAMDRAQAIAAIRFALGRRPSDPLPADPVAWLDSQLAPGIPAPTLPEGVPPDLPGLYAASAEDTQNFRAGMGRPNLARIVRGGGPGAEHLAQSPLRQRIQPYPERYGVILFGKGS